MDGRESRAFTGSVPGGFWVACSASHSSSVLTTTKILFTKKPPAFSRRLTKAQQVLICLGESPGGPTRQT